MERFGLLLLVFSLSKFYIKNFVTKWMNQDLQAFEIYLNCLKTYDKSGDEDFDVASLDNEDDKSDSDGDSDDETTNERRVSVTGSSSSRSSTPTADYSDWVPVEIPEPENMISDPGFTVMSSESVQNIPDKTFLPYLDL